LPLYDFLHAIADIAPEFSSVWTVNLETTEAEYNPLPDIFRIISLFRDHQRLANARRSKSSGAFPASLKDQPLESGPSTKDPKDPRIDPKKRPCIYGTEHLFSACPYLIKSLHPHGWTTDPEIQKVVDEKLKIAAIKTAVDRDRQKVAKSQAQERQPKQVGAQEGQTGRDEGGTVAEKAGVFTVNCYSTANPSDYNLQNSFILDSGATVHICNSRNQFQTITPASEDDLLYAGNIIIPIERFGSVDIIVQTPAGPKLIELQNTALVPSFHTSVVSLKRIVAKKVYWDMENDRLTQAGKTFYTVQTRHDQWVLEYNPVNDHSVFAVRSAQPLPVMKASPLTWHLRLGHPNTDIIDHLPQSVIGAKVEKAPTKIECETCSISKAKAIIFGRPTVQLSAPYEEIAFDLVQMSSAHNDDWVFLHFLCLRTWMNHIYALANKREVTLKNSQRTCRFCKNSI
jgi:hypothetical protein